MAQRVRQGGVRCPQGERQLSSWISEGPTKEAARSGLSTAFESCWISCDNLGYKLAEEFFWYNSAKLPSPIEWVNKRKVRVKDSVNGIVTLIVLGRKGPHGFPFRRPHWHFPIH